MERTDGPPDEYLRLLAARLHLTAAPKAKSAPEFRKEIMDYLDLRWDIEGSGATVRYMRAKFGMHASRLGLNIRDLLEDMIVSREIFALQRGRVTVVISWKVNYMLECPPDVNKMDWFEERARIEDNFFAASQDPVKVKRK